MRRIAVTTAGGDAPGMNAAIRSIVRVATFHRLEVIGIERGFAGLIEGQVRPLGARSVSGIINRGGTNLKLHDVRRSKLVKASNRRQIP